MVKIYKYKNYLETTEYKADQEWTQVDNNLTSIASILISIDSLEKNECLVLRKITKEK